MEQDIISNFYLEWIERERKLKKAIRLAKMVSSVACGMVMIVLSPFFILTPFLVSTLQLTPFFIALILSSQELFIFAEAKIKSSSINDKV